MKKTKLESSLAKTLRRSDLSNTLMELGELGIDELLPEVVSKIPVLGTIQSVCKIWGTVSDHLFAEKMLRFLRNLGDVSVDIRESELHDMDDDSHSERVSLHLLMVIEKTTRLQKIDLIANAYRGYLEGSVDREELFSFTHLIDVIEISLLEHLKDFYVSNKQPNYPTLLAQDDLLQRLLAVGLVSMEYAFQREVLVSDSEEVHYGEINGGELRILTNDLGSRFLQVVCQTNISDIKHSPSFKAYDRGSYCRQ